MGRVDVWRWGRVSGYTGCCGGGGRVWVGEASDIGGEGGGGMPFTGRWCGMEWSFGAISMAGCLGWWKGIGRGGEML